MPWTLMPPRAASVSAVVEIMSPKNAKNSHCSAVNASSSAEDIKRIVPAVKKVADRHKVPRRKKKPQPPGMRIKAPKRKKKTRARAKTGPSPYKE